jgi:hypothetical protein
MGCTSEDSRFDSRQEKEVFIFSIKYRLVVGSTKPPIERVPEVKWQELYLHSAMYSHVVMLN